MDTGGALSAWAVPGHCRTCFFRPLASERRSLDGHSAISKFRSPPNALKDGQDDHQPRQRRTPPCRLRSRIALSLELQDGECGEVAIKGRESAPCSVSAVGDGDARFKYGCFRPAVQSTGAADCAVGKSPRQIRQKAGAVFSRSSGRNAITHAAACAWRADDLATNRSDIPVPGSVTGARPDCRGRRCLRVGPAMNRQTPP